VRCDCVSAAFEKHSDRVKRRVTPEDLPTTLGVKQPKIPKVSQREIAEFVREERRNLDLASAALPPAPPAIGRRPVLVEINLQEVISAGIGPSKLELDIKQGTATDKRIREAYHLLSHPARYRGNIRFVRRRSPKGRARWVEVRAFDRLAYESRWRREGDAIRRRSPQGVDRYHLKLG
jgi:hypothetical protein